MRFSFLLAAVLLFMALNWGCNPILYNSTTPPLNLTTQAGQVYGAASYGSNGASYNFGFSLPAKLQLAFGYTSLHESGDKSSDNMTAREYLLGLYHDFDVCIVEAFLGVGIGEGSSKNTEESLFSSFTETNSIEGSFHKLIGQINLGVSRGPFESGLSVRVSDLNFHNVKKISSRRGVFYEGSERCTIWEPTIFTGIGNKNLRLRFMITVPIVNGLKDVTYNNFIMSLGASVGFCL